MESTQKRLRTASAANFVREARSKPFSGRFSLDFGTQNDLRFERDRRAKLASKGAAMNIATVRRVPQNAVCQLCSPKSEIAGAARKIDGTATKNQLRNATCDDPDDAAVSSTIFAPKSTQIEPKSTRIGSSGASIGPLERSKDLDRPARATKVDSRGLGRAPRVAPESLRATSGGAVIRACPNANRLIRG